MESAASEMSGLEEVEVVHKEMAMETAFRENVSQSSARHQAKGSC